MAFVILFGSEVIFFGIDVALLHFCVLIKKDGGIRPRDVLATCANKVLNSIRTSVYWYGTDKFRVTLTCHFLNKPFKFQV